MRKLCTQCTLALNNEVFKQILDRIKQCHGQKITEEQKKSCESKVTVAIGSQKSQEIIPPWSNEFTSNARHLMDFLVQPKQLAQIIKSSVRSGDKNKCNGLLCFSTNTPDEKMIQKLYPKPSFIITQNYEIFYFNAIAIIKLDCDKEIVKELLEKLNIETTANFDQLPPIELYEGSPATAHVERYSSHELPFYYNDYVNSLCKLAAIHCISERGKIHFLLEGIAMADAMAEKSVFNINGLPLKSVSYKEMNAIFKFLTLHPERRANIEFYGNCGGQVLQPDLQFASSLIAKRQHRKQQLSSLSATAFRSIWCVESLREHLICTRRAMLVSKDREALHFALSKNANELKCLTSDAASQFEAVVETKKFSSRLKLLQTVR
jgi:hypothetical protein